MKRSSRVPASRFPGRSRRLLPIDAVPLASVMTLAGARAQSPDAARYPDMRARWTRLGSAQWDPAKPAGRGQQIYLDKADPDVLHDDITVIDHVLTRPWTVQHKYVCEESNRQVIVGKENYFVSADGYLMPTKKDQPPPELNGSNRSPR